MTAEKNTNKFYYIFGILGFLVLIAIDQITKLLACQTIQYNGPKVLIPNVFELHYLENSGAAWGMFSGMKFIFVLIALVITFLIGWIYIKMPADKKYIPLRISLVMLASGAIGNMIDRIVNSYVIDFFYFKLIDFPVFNVADIYVTISAIALLALLIFVYKDKDFDFLKKGKK